MHEAKIKEIEDAYQEWLSEYAKSLKLTDL